MDQLESVFVEGDTTIAENNDSLWPSVHGENEKLKIGEVFQLENKTLSLSCIRCCETFQYFTEFTLHIQDHYLYGEIANLKEVKEEPTEDNHDKNASSIGFKGVENLPNLQNASLHMIKNDENSNDSVDSNAAGFIDDTCSVFQDYFEAENLDVHSKTASDDESKENILKTDETNNDKNNKSFGEPKTLEFVEGEHFTKDGKLKKCLTCDRIIERWDHLKDHLYTHVAEKNVICPVCSKAFASIAYVRKHCGKVHKKKFSSIQIKGAQKWPGGAVNVIQIKFKSNVNETNAKEQLTDETHESSNNKFSPTIKGYKCEHCIDKHFTKPRYLQKHMQCVHALKIQIQSIIGMHPTSPKYESIHKPPINVKRRTFDESEKNYQCYICKTRVRTMNSLKKHLKLHSGKKYQCFIKDCQKIFGQPHYVMDHLAIVHGLKKTSALRAKIQVVSNSDYSYEFERQNASSYQCYLCKHEFSSKLRLNVHFKNHLHGPFLCTQCGVTLKTIDTLRHHFERHLANPDEPVPCPKCKKTYPTRRYMLRHLRMMHTADEEEQKPKSVKLKKVGAKMFDCEMDQCKGKFSSLSRMKQHMVTHKKKLYECLVCGWKCKIKSNLNQHQKVHLTNKTPCTICDKLLSTRYLADHMRMHAGLKFVTLVEFPFSICKDLSVTCESFTLANQNSNVR